MRTCTTRKRFPFHIVILRTVDRDGDELPDLTELDREQTYNYTIAGIPRAVPYWTVHSRPDMTDSDGDGLGDKVDPLPMTRSNVMEFVEKVGELEDWIEGYWESSFGNPNQRSIKTNTINLLRSLSYNGMSWKMTSGLFDNGAFDLLIAQKASINTHDPNLLPFFKQNSLVAYDGSEVDFIHMMATMSAYYYNTPFFDDDYIDDLAGWGADLQSFIKNLKLSTNGSDDPQMLLSYVTSKLFISGTLFDLDDLHADVDALNIYKALGESGYLSADLELFYEQSPEFNRYEKFVENMGGLVELERRAIDYTKGTSFPKHSKLTEYAKAAHDANHDISSSVSETESYALATGFIWALQTLYIDL